MNLLCPRRLNLLFTGLTTIFLKEFLFDLWLTAPLLLSLAAVVTVLGQVAGKKEGWSPFDSFYWSFITATTVGYGDMRPTKRSAKILAIAIPLAGLTFSVYQALGQLLGHSEDSRVEFLSCSLIWRGLQPGLACTGTLICFL